MLSSQCIDQKGRLIDKAFFFAKVYGDKEMKMTKDYDQYLGFKTKGYFDTEIEAAGYYAPKPPVKKKRKKK